MDIQKVKDFWRDEAEEALRVAYHLFEKKDYSYSLFFGHLAVEKILKAVYVVVKEEHPPYIHNLIRLAEAVDIHMTEKQRDDLIRITSFNLEARYPDEQRSFRKKCTVDFTGSELERTGEVFQWLKSMLQ
jgi:HEPN domain-containing protein